MAELLAEPGGVVGGVRKVDGDQRMNIAFYTQLRAWTLTQSGWELLKDFKQGGQWKGTIIWMDDLRLRTG